METSGRASESVWDYPRPPRLERSERRVRVSFGGEVVAESVRAWRVLETSHPPVYYIPREDVGMDLLRESGQGGSFCEFKGTARYWDLVVGDRVSMAAGWSYEAPTPAFAGLKGCVAFYPGRVDQCRVDDEQVLAQAGDFYGGWITGDVTGPFKGAAGTRGW